MTSSEQLYNYMTSHEDSIRDGFKFKGVYASNELPVLNKSDLERGVCIIMNMDPNFKSGSHWLGMRISKNSCEYFDSYGEQPDSDDSILNDRTKFRDYLGRYSNNGYKSNIYDLQGLTSEVCGLYSILFCLTGLDYDYWKSLGFILTPRARINNKNVVQSAYPETYSHNDELIRQLIKLQYR